MATFSIYNTFSIIVAQRSRESALMRAIGATRRQIMNATMVEALLIGVLASVTGLVAGLGIAAGLKGVFDAFGLNLPAGGLTLKASSAIVGIVVGILVTVMAAIFPARKGSRVAPIEALRASAVEVEVPRRIRGVVGVVLAVVGIATIVIAVTAHPDLEIQIAGIGAAVTLIAMLVLGPVIARPVAGLIGAPLARLGGVTGELSRENADPQPAAHGVDSRGSPRRRGRRGVVHRLHRLDRRTWSRDSVDKTFGGDLVITSGGFGDPDAADLTRRPTRPRSTASIGPSASVSARSRSTATPTSLERRRRGAEQPSSISTSSAGSAKAVRRRRHRHQRGQAEEDERRHRRHRSTVEFPDGDDEEGRRSR